jgi:beta-galactosidase
MGSGYFRLIVRHTNKCLEVQDWSTSDGTAVIQGAVGDNYQNNEQWSFVKEGDYYQIINRNSGKLVDVQACNPSNGGKIHQWSYYSDDALSQRWSFISVSGSGATPDPTQTTTATPTSPPNGSLGDVNNDGSVNIVDALMTAQYYVGLNPSGFNAGNQTTARRIIPFDRDWRFFKGDASGADQAGFVDTSWQSVNVPHDWSIEGPFAESNPTGAGGGYLPSGIGWYRKHFTLAQDLSSSRVFIEFDGVMANSDVYINGYKLGNRPNGYVSFRYELTGHISFGSTGNVIAVRVNDSAQPASRWYTGAGIYRHVRVIATNPVHIDKWATYVTTPTVSTSQATVHVQTTVVNQGTGSQSVAIQATIVGPNGNKLMPVISSARNINASGSALFALDIQVANPSLWSTDSPDMYQVLTEVLAGGAAVDNDTTAFSIRTINFDPDNGFFLNGTNMKFKGVCLHHDMSGLGAAVPQRAWKRRLEQLKVLGVNAIRTSHNPVAPEFLDLCDKMGFLVMDEFFDVWKAHKVSADYATYFDSWGVTDLTDTLLRDRNHPSIVLYSIGNEIRDSISTRLPIAENFVQICHSIDPTRPVTQGLFRPKDSGDYPGAMLDVLDVFGVNYRSAELLEAQAITPHRPGVLTEMTPTTSNWNVVLSNPQITGMLDRVGTPREIGYTFQGLWSTTPVSRPNNGTTASRIVLSADQTTFTTDLNDVVYIKATICDSSNRLIPGASTTVTFGVSGPGKIIAVDSGIATGDSFRGNQRNAFGGICFAIIQATSAGSITVSASASGLAGDSVSMQAFEGTYTP